MKNLVFLLLLLTFACSSIPKSFKKYDMEGFSHDGNKFFYHNHPIAEIQAMTFSLDGHELVKEINLKVLDPQFLNKIPHLIKYVHESHRTSEVEVELFMINDKN